MRVETEPTGTADEARGDLRIVRRYERPALRPLQQGRWRALRLVTVLVDLLALGGALLGASLIRFGSGALLEDGSYGAGLALWLALWFGGLLSVGLYDLERIQNPAEELRRVMRGVTLGAAAAVVASFSVHFPLSRGWLLLAWALALVGVGLGRRALRKTVYYFRRRGRLRRRTLIVGTDPSAVALAHAVTKAPWEGFDVVGFVSIDRSAGEPLPAGLQQVGPADRLRELTAALRVTDVLVAPNVAGNGHFTEVVSALDGVPVNLRIAPGLDGFMPSRLTVQPLGDRPLVSVERGELNPTARVAKRILDLVLGTILLALSAPVLLACVVAVRLGSPGPVFFKQRRVGLRGRLFTMWKLRTMQPGAEEQRLELEYRNEADGLLFKIEDDPRVTRVGRFLRRTSLDELPQLLNVLAGHMSLVGPRPPLPGEVTGYSDRMGRRLLVKPGMTGLWQVSGRNELSFEDYLRYDVLYVQNWSVVLDLYILWKTLPAVLFRRGAR
jgi:exopolysaccharide biosynthesis polyprenyl glycosylphosphotransferase